MGILADDNKGAFKGSINTAELATIFAQSGRYAVLGTDDLKASTGTGDRAIALTAGRAWGDGVLSTWLEGTDGELIGEPVASGSRWDTVVIRRTWLPNGQSVEPFGTAELKILKGSGVRAVSTARTTDAGSTTSDQPLWLARFEYGKNIVQELVDLRVWAGAGGGLLAVDLAALGYLSDPGTHVTVAGRRYVREITGVWRSDAIQGEWQAYGRAAGWTATDGTLAPAARIVGDTVEFRTARLNRSANHSFTAGNLYTIGTLTSTYRPAATVSGVGTIRYANSAAPILTEVLVLTSGAIQIRPAESGSMTTAQTGPLAYPGFTWPAP